MSQCCVRVFDSRAGSHPCLKPVKVERDGQPYCAIHDPVAKAKRDAERDSAYARKMDAVEWQFAAMAACRGVPLEKLRQGLLAELLAKEEQP